MADESPPLGDAGESPWRDGQTAVWLHRSGGTVTLVEGTTFCVSASSGDIEPGSPTGLFVLDTRILSRLRLTVDGELPRSLGSVPTGPVSVSFVASCEPSVGRPERLVVVRRRRLGQGLRETAEIQKPPAVHHRQWRRTGPTLRSSNEDLDAVFAQSMQDLGTLRVFDPDHRDRRWSPRERRGTWRCSVAIRC